MMKRIILHWTAGTNTASALDKRHYHYIIQGDGSIVEGIFGPEDNISTATPYAAHTRGMNTGSIGVALAAMHGATERPFNAGKYPITAKQVDALVGLISRLCDQYGIAVTPQTVLTHAEVEGTLGAKQRGKWDVTWLPGMDQAGHPSAVGDLLRQKVRTYKDRPKTIWAAIAAILKGLRK
jgi:N-acetyl-anhydromuramyl-L-alanine amidase AmpD